MSGGAQTIHRVVSRSISLESDNGYYVNYAPDPSPEPGPVDLGNPILLTIYGVDARRARLLLFAELADDGFERVDDLVAIDAALRKADLQVELLGRRPIGEHVLLRPSWFRLRRRFP